MLCRTHAENRILRGRVLHPGLGAGAGLGVVGDVHIEGAAVLALDFDDEALHFWFS